MRLAAVLEVVAVFVFVVLGSVEAVDIVVAVLVLVRTVERVLAVLPGLAENEQSLV